jgi:hypothetical protein
MPTSENVNTAGVVVSQTTISNTGVSSGFTGGNNNLNNQKFRARVTGIDPTNGNVYFESNFQNYNKSELGTPNLKNIARPLDIYYIKIPMVGEIIEIITAPEAIGLSSNKNNSNNIPYYDRILNAWDNINGNKVLDNSVSDQLNNNPLNNFDQTNINKSIILGGII